MSTLCCDAMHMYLSMSPDQVNETTAPVGPIILCSRRAFLVGCGYLFQSLKRSCDTTEYNRHTHKICATWLNLVMSAGIILSNGY